MAATASEVITIKSTLYLSNKCSLTGIKKDKREYKTIRVTYPIGSREGVPEAKTVMEISGNWVRITTVSNKREADAPVQVTYLDYNINREIKTALLSGDESIYTVRSFTINDRLEFLDETEVIAGYKCKKQKPSSTPTPLKSGILPNWRCMVPYNPEWQFQTELF